MSDSAVEFNPRPVFYAVAAALWLLGFVCALMPLALFEAETFFVAILCVFSAAFFVLAVFCMVDLRAMARAPVMWLALAFWALAALSAALSEVPFVSFIYFCFFSVLPLSFFITALQGGGETVFFKIGAWALAVLLAVFSFSCVVQFLFIPDMLTHGLVAWPLANPNSLAGVLSFGFLGALGWMLIAPRRGLSNLALVLAIAALAAIFTTGSRGAVLALVPALIVLGVFGRAHLRKHVRCLSVLAVAGILAFLVLTFLAPAGTQVPGAVAGKTLAGKQLWLSTRPALWASALEIFKAHPLTGTGVGTFFLYYPEVRNLGDATSAGFMAHSDPLQFAVEMGFLGPLVFYSFLVLAVLRSLKALKSLPPDDPRRVKILVPVCALGAMILHTHVTFHFHVLSILMLAGLMLGYWFVQTQAADAARTPTEEPHSNPLLRWALAVPLVVILAVFGQWQASEILVNRSRAAMANGALEDSINLVNRAGHLSGKRNARAMVMAANYPLGILQLNAPLMEKAELVGMYENTRLLLDQAHAANPRLASIVFHRAELLSFVGPFLPKEMKPQDGEVAYLLREALSLDPLHIGSRVMLANLALRKGEKQGALDILKEGLPWIYGGQNPRHFLEKTINLATELGDEETVATAKVLMRRYMSKQEREEAGP